MMDSFFLFSVDKGTKYFAFRYNFSPKHLAVTGKVCNFAAEKIRQELNAGHVMWHSEGLSYLFVYTVLKSSNKCSFIYCNLFRQMTKYYLCVCRCTPDRGVVSMDAQLLGEVVHRGLHAIRCAKNPRVKAQKALLLGELCEGAGYPRQALRVWTSTVRMIEAVDYDWVYEPLAPSWSPYHVSFSSVVSMDECRELGRRIDALWRRLGHPEMSGWERRALRSYRDMWLDKYSCALP
jgi:hypothetical protein